MKKNKKRLRMRQRKPTEYTRVLSTIVRLLDEARGAVARNVNILMTVTYWEVGRHIVEFEQGGTERADYGSNLLQRLSTDLTRRVGRGFSVDNLENMRQFYLIYPHAPISETASRNSDREISETASRKSDAAADIDLTLADQQSLSLNRNTDFYRFALPWSHYVQLIKVADSDARDFYETEALRHGWTVRQLERQITTLFYERTLASRDKAAMLERGAEIRPGEATSAIEQIKDPFFLEFLNLKDEYSESDLEEALIEQLESFLLELGGDFAFIGRQKRLRIGREWYRIDLLLFHRRLRCLVIIDLKLGKFTHADAGQMTLYLNYARKHWTNADENPPVGLILCTEKDDAVVHYALDGLQNVLAAQYRTKLPNERMLVAELKRSRRRFESRFTSRSRKSFVD